VSRLPLDENVKVSVENDLKRLSPSTRKVLYKLILAQGRLSEVNESEWRKMQAIKSLTNYGIVEKVERGMQGR
jgi:hypothetical protein